jgi:hypothetical protein
MAKDSMPGWLALCALLVAGCRTAALPAARNGAAKALYWGTEGDDGYREIGARPA